MGSRTELSHGFGHGVKKPHRVPKAGGGWGQSLTEFRMECHGVPQGRSTLDHNGGSQS